MKEKYQRYDLKSTLCWKCKWATGLENKCPWASKGQAVKGWKAKRRDMVVANNGACEEYVIESYIVIKCPLFEPDRR